MGALVDSCFCLLGMAVFVGSRTNHAGCRSRRRVVSLLAGLGILAFTFSAISSDGDLLQHESMQPTAQSPGATRYARMVRSVSPFSVTTLLAPMHPPLLPEASGRFVALRRVPIGTLGIVPISIHSPPLPPGVADANIAGAFPIAGTRRITEKRDRLCRC